MSIAIYTKAFSINKPVISIALPKEAYSCEELRFSGYYGSFLLKYQQGNGFNLFYTEGKCRDNIIIAYSDVPQSTLVAFKLFGSYDIADVLFKSQAKPVAIEFDVSPFSTLVLPAPAFKCFFIELFNGFADCLPPGARLLDDINNKASKTYHANKSQSAAIVEMLQELLIQSYAPAIRELFAETKLKELLLVMYQVAEQSLPAPMITTAHRKQLMQVKEAIDAGEIYSLSVAAIATMYNITEDQLKRTFKALFGFNITDYLRKTRLEKAKLLLLQNEMSIKEIAFTTGFNNVPNFYESYKRYFGIAPGAERNTSKP